MTERSNREEDAVAVLAHHYGLKQPRILGLLEASARNENFLVEDRKRAQYVLRRYRRNPEQRRVALQLEFQQHLANNRFPTPRIILTKFEAPFVTLNDVPWALFEYLQGAGFDFARHGQVAEAGRRLAELHELGKSFGEAEVLVDWEGSYREPWLDPEGNMQALHELFFGEDVADELRIAAAVWDRLVRSWPLQRLDSLPQGWGHGDYHGRNMVFDEDHMVGLFDFDGIFHGPLAFDVAYATFMFGRLNRGSHQLRPDTARSFLDAYGEIRTLSREEVECIPMLLVFTRAPYAPHYCYRQRDGDNIVELLRESVSFIKDIGEEMKRLEPEFGWTAV